MTSSSAIPSMTCLQASEKESELSHIKKDIQRVQTQLSDARDERDEALHKIQELQAQSRLVRLS